MDLGDAISELETFVWLLRNQTQIDRYFIKNTSQPYKAELCLTSKILKSKEICYNELKVKRCHASCNLKNTYDLVKISRLIILLI